MNSVNNIETRMQAYTNDVLRGNADERAAVILKAAAFDAVMMGNKEDAIASLMVLAPLTDSEEEKITYYVKIIQASRGDTVRFIEACRRITIQICDLKPSSRVIICRGLEAAGEEAFVNLFFSSVASNGNKPKEERSYTTVECDEKKPFISYRWYHPKSTSVLMYMYSSVTKHLWVVFTSDPSTTYMYKNIPEHIARGLHFSDSKGSFVNEFIVKPKYAFVKKKV